MVLIKTTDPLILKEANSVIDYWRSNPVIAANQLLRRDGDPLVLAPIQEVILTEWWNHNFNLLTAARGTGKTFTAAVYTALRSMLYPGFRTGIFAPAFRQSKLIFKEFTKLHSESPYLQSCVSREPTQLNDQCVCTFKSILPGRSPSEVIALPVGTDGGKIRGTRLNRVILDEIPHLPESIFRSSIQPMLSTASNPMQKVKELERIKNLDHQSYLDLLKSTENGYIGITSGYYQFNYWWEEMIKFYQHIQSGSALYNLRFTPYTELPEGFYDMSVVEDARLNSPSHMFLTEWMAEWVSDSAGAFPMSLLEACRDEKVIPKYSRDANTDKGKNYVFGLDVARERDSTAICVIELGFPSKVVFISELEETPFPKQSNFLFELIEKFNPIRIYMDEFGGGGTLRDNLADPSSVGWPVSHKVISVDESPVHAGKRILQLCNFNPSFIEDANNNTKTLLERRAILFPTATNPIESLRKGNAGQKKEIDLVQEMINQIACVVVSETTTGRLHYDLPKVSASKFGNKVRKKDLYTAFILACKCVYDLEWKPKADKLIVEQGIIQEMINTNNPKKGRLTYNPGSNIINNGDLSKKTIVPGGGIIITKNVRRK